MSSRVLELAVLHARILGVQRWPGFEVLEEQG
jgi:hypothetical protein